MQKRALGFLLAILGFGGMALAGYLFVTGTGDRGHLIEVTCYMIVGAASFFSGINLIYDSYTSFSASHLKHAPELEEISPIQQQWRTIQVSKQPTSTAPLAVNMAAEAV